MLITFNKICLVLTYNAEWCVAGGEKKREMGGGLGRAVAGAFSLAAHLPPPVPSGGPHHSAANAVSCGIPFILGRTSAVDNAVEPPHCDGSTDALPYIFTNFLTTTPWALRKLTT